MKLKKVYLGETKNFTPSRVGLPRLSPRRRRLPRQHVEGHPRQVLHVLHLLLDHLPDVRVQVDGEGDEDAQVGGRHRLAVVGEERLELLLVAVHLQQRLNLLLGGDGPAEAVVDLKRLLK